MCFHYAMSENAKTLENRFKAQMESKNFAPRYHANGFQFPEMPVITNTKFDKIQVFKWGLIPSWVKTTTKAEDIRKFTLNARSDTIFEKASFKNSIQKKRCLIPATGFFEWHHHKNNKYPYFIFMPQNKIFCFAGIWETWKNENNQLINTFSIITTVANQFVAKIHNTKKRMPIILKPEQEKKWLKQDLKQDEIKSFFNPNNLNLHAYTVNKNLGNPKINSNIPEILEKYDINH